MFAPVGEVENGPQGDKIGRLFSLGSFFENLQRKPNFGPLFSTVENRYVLILPKNIGGATFWASAYSS
jgi:hypothetical protein